MGIYIQPREIDIPTDDPFRNDLLSRRESAEILTHLIGSINGPCVLAVDAAWGAGKTTFLRLWAQHLRNSEFPVVEFNAWETDHSGDPFIALSSELTEGLRHYMDKTDEKIKEIKTAAIEVLRHVAPGAIRFATAGILNIDHLLEKEIGQLLASYASDRLARHNDAQKSIDKFKNTLREVTSRLSQSKGDRSLIVMIDELDRCRPTYAIELLEVAKHLFSVDGVIFVLAVNRSELVHSIRALYGSGFNAEGYLHRFFDVDLRLPDPERELFINATLDSMQISDYLSRTKDRQAREYENIVRKLLTGFFGARDLSLRQIAQAIHRLGLVFASLSNDQRWFFPTAVVVLILRTLDLDVYRRFLRSQISDLEVVESVFAHVGSLTLQRTDEGRIFEAIIIVGYRDIAKANYSGSKFVSPLEKKYNVVIETYMNKYNIHEPYNSSLNLEYEHASRVISIVHQFLQNIFTGGQSVGFIPTVERIELLSRDLIDEPDYHCS